MKNNINPVIGGVIVVIVLGVAIFFGIRSAGTVQKSHEPVDMAKLMGKAPIAPPANAGNRGMMGGQSPSSPGTAR